MQLVGRAVKHNAFGSGIITNFTGEVVTICFSQGDKKFIYPDAFVNFLTLKDKSVHNEINAVWNRRMQKENAQKQVIQEEQERLYRIRTLKISPNSQAAFHLDSSDIDAAFASATVSTGCFLSGYSKGKPRIPGRLKPNSACLLTTCPQNGQEKERRIIGAFMARDDFFGNTCKNGIIESHEQHKVFLNLENSLPYWDYFDHTEPIPRWGRTAFKYFSNDTMQQILLDLNNTLRDTDKESVIHGFYRYFCEVNRLPYAKE